MTDFVVQPLPAGEVDVDVATCVRRVAEGGEPCRRCLRRAQAGEPLLLLGYDPFLVRSPYAGSGPVFVHEACRESGAAADQVRGSVLSVRAYDADAMLLDAEVMPGEALGDRAAEMLDGDAAFLHVHFAGPGCFAFRIDPAG
jgi:Protein of unknown function (DUF1203)